MKTLADLINTADPAWPLIQEWLAEAANPVEILPRDPAAAEAELVKTQVSTRSVMGAVVYETGGILIDQGWLRILGSGSPACRAASAAGISAAPNPNLPRPRPII